MKVLMISHTCQSRVEGQPKALELARLGFDVRVVVPRRWREYGKWRGPEFPSAKSPTERDFAERDFAEGDSAARNFAPDGSAQMRGAMADKSDGTESAGPSFGLVPLTVKWPWLGPIQSYAHFYPGLGRVIAGWKPDVIDIWEEPWSLVSLQVCRLRDRLCADTPIVSETEQNLEKTLPPPFEAIRSQVLRRADFLVGRSLEATQIAARKGFSGPMRVVPNAVDARRFRPLSAPEKRRVRADLGWDAGTDAKTGGQTGAWVCGYIGRLVEEKGLGDLLDALALCPPQIRLVMVGSGPFEAPLRAQIAALGLESRARILAARPQSELAPLMGALDALILPSRTTARWKEQFGRVIIEAQACGVPVVGSDSGAIPDVVADAGLIFPEGQAPALAAQLQHLAAHPEQGRALGARGLTIVHQKYTWACVARDMAEIYAELGAR